MGITPVHNVESMENEVNTMHTGGFGDLDGLRMAAEMEKRGGEFYSLAARVSKKSETRALLTSLASDEAIHLREFQRLYERECQKTDSCGYAPEMSAYLSALAAEIAFPGGVVSLAGHLESPESILKHAIRSEEDSIRFYSGVAQATSCAETARVFQDIIRQETGHLHRLEKMLSEL